MKHDNFLVSIAADICRTRDPVDDSYVLADVKDKVVQDVDETEGTGTWTCEEGIHKHVPIPTIASGHLLMVASADAAQRAAVKKSFGTSGEVGKIKLETPQDTALPAFLKDLQMATYASFLMAFAQGLQLLKKADKEHDWKLDFASIMQLWRGGCIIQSDFIIDLFEKIYRGDGHDHDDLLRNREIGQELEKAYPSLKKVVLKSVEADAYVPSLSASLEYYKYSGSTDLPTQFLEAELDYFGAHMFDLKSEGPGKAVAGSHHFEWKPAKGIFNDAKEKP